MCAVCVPIRPQIAVRRDDEVDRSGVPVEDSEVGEYALVTAAVASLAISIATIPEGKLAARLPTTQAKALALATRDARARGVAAVQAKQALARAPYRRASLRYLYVSGWLEGRKSPASCLFAKSTPDSTTSRTVAGIRKDSRLVGRLARMHVTVAQAAGAIVRGAASAC
jgi:hypothetical protein